MHPQSPSGMEPYTSPHPQRTKDNKHGRRLGRQPSNHRCEVEKELMKLLRKIIPFHPIIDPTLRLIGYREPWVGTLVHAHGHSLHI